MGRKKSYSKTKTEKYILLFIAFCIFALLGCSDVNLDNGIIEQNASINDIYKDINLSNIPEYSGAPYVVINNNVPFFENLGLTTSAFESYGELDEFGRCSVAVACIGEDLMPTEERGSIGSVKPTGWHTAKYEGIDGKYLYNRCHLIGFQLTGENANTQNLITGTRYMNTEGMLPFENMVADYIKETNNHVMYRVTPVFQGDDLLASGVVIEAKSIEDNGEGVLFNVYCYNVQPGINIDYATGDSIKE
ncbi:MAG: DNA/RNA non-specific endonuclease [Clostridia bacterium]|nr:DNA/RNA non-specific endonuclease [Clostridia bacterium]